MDLEGIRLSERQPMEKDKHHMISLICVIWKQKKKTKKNVDTQNSTSYQKGRDGGEWNG